ncbi:MAG: hypothetical protein V2A54_00320 [Bacteroidota bacterium]
MRTITISVLICFLFTSNAQGQVNDSSDVKQITYKPDLGNRKMILVSKQQLKAKPYYDKGYSYIGNNEFNKAIKPLKKAIKIDSTGNCGTGKNGMAYSELGYAFSRLNDISNAFFYLDKTIEINKFVPEPYLSKSVILMKQGKNDLALKELDSCIKNNPEYALVYVQRAFLFSSIKNYELALQDYSMFLKVIKEQNQEQNSSALVEEVKKQIKELEQKIKK